MEIVSPSPTIVSHLVKPEDLNHHGTLFAGRMSEWFVEACFIAVSRLIGRPEDVVCAQVHGITFRRSATKGDIIEIRARIAFTGSRSATAYAEACVNQIESPSVTGLATFVTVGHDGKSYAHGLSLSEEYINENKAIYEEAIKVRAQKIGVPSR